jgi:hypothetical protein
MKRATLQDQYNLISEGQGHKGVFLNDAKRMFPQYILNQSNYEQTVQILKEKNILKENIQVVTGSDKQPDWFKIFEDNIKNIKVESKKVDKEVEELETKGFDYKDPKNLDNQIGQEVLQGLYCELKNDPELELEKAKDKVAKNLTKNPLYYVENGQFGVEGLGYVTEHPGLGEPKEPKGKHKSSGYGDIPKEMKGNVNKSGLINESKKKSKKKSNMKEQKLRKIVRSIIKEEMEGETLLNKANELVATHGDMVPDDLVTYMKDDWNIVISRKEAHELIDQLENSNHPYYSWPEGDYDYEDDPEARYFRNMETNAERFSGYGEDY